MKKTNRLFSISILALLSALLLNASCEQKPVYEDEQLGLQVFTEEVSFENIAVLTDNRLKTNKATAYGEIITVQIMGAAGFEEKNQRVFVGGEIVLYDDKETIIKEIPDILKQYEKTGVTPEDIKQISFKMSTGKPLVTGQQYQMVARLWDKSGKGEITCRLLLDIE
jgi:hypothetical protein